MPTFLTQQEVAETINLPSEPGVKPIEILERNFRYIRQIGSLPISGGWGYTKEDAVIIDRDSPILKQQDSVDIQRIVSLFIEYRTYQELTEHPEPGKKYNEIKCEFSDYSIIGSGDQKYWRLDYQISSIRDGDYIYLANDWDSNNGFTNDPEGLKKHDEEYNDRLVKYDTTFWFDVSDFSDGFRVSEIMQ